MSQRASAIMWLIMALFCGVLTLVAAGGGGYGIWHAQVNQKLVKERIEEDTKAQKDPKNLVNKKKQDELASRQQESNNEENYYERFWYYSVAAASISVIPALMTLIFLGVGAMQYMRKKRPAPKDDEEEEEEEDETPAEEPDPEPKPKK